MSAEERAPIPPWRTWAAVGLGTLVQAVSFGSILVGAVASAQGSEQAGGPAFTIGFSLVPVVFALVAFISAVENAPISILKAMGLWLVLALPLSLLHPAVGMTAGFTAAAAVTLRRPEEPQRWTRAGAVAINTLYVTGLVLILPQAAVFAAAVTPLFAIKVADAYDDRRRARRSGQ